MVRLIDQTLLPLQKQIITCHTAEEVADAIRSMRLRGAPAIGVAAALGTALAAHNSTANDVPSLVEEVIAAARLLASTRPTAVNLFWALERMQRAARAAAAASPPLARLREALVTEALAIAREDEAGNRALSGYGADLIPAVASILTHCNAGALATSGEYGTALGVIRAAREQGKQLHVFVDETRPFLQGARLTAWELQQLGVPLTLITDNMAGHFMQRGRVDLAIVGADRIAANGDVANKIGTYPVAVLANVHRIPFYVAAPTSTIDLTLADGSAIPIEERDPDEVTTWGGVRVAPSGVAAAHPAFDVTPARLVAAIITERGVVRPPYGEGLRALFANEVTA